MMFGDGTPVAITFGDGTPAFGSTDLSGLPYVEFTLNQANFNPEVELAPQRTASIEWLDGNGNFLASGLAPAIALSAPPYVVRMRCSDPTAVRSLNLGFNAGDDAGRDGPGAAYNKAAQPVVGVTGLTVLTDLIQFMAASTPLTGHLDFTGMSNLLYIECFMANVTSIDLTGCTRLIRLCMEANALSHLDLNPVADCLYDLRAAVQDAPSLTFETLDRPMANLWHYCVRDQVVLNMIPHAQLPVITQHWTWDTHQTSTDTPTSAVLGSYLSYANSYDQASLDRILTGLDALGNTGGYVDLSNNGGGVAPSAAGLAARDNLVAKGWSVTL